MLKPLRVSGLAAALLLSGLCAAAAPPQLPAAGKLYLWPMINAFDQYLAEQITADGVFEVVVDPKLANTIMTERIDSTFLKAMDELFPRPAANGESEKAAANTKNDDSIEGGGRDRRPANHPRGQARGTLFLVDVASRKVVWSTYLKEFDPSPNKLHSQAGSVVEKLRESSAAQR
jgi:hypothetical protein